jgi:hypothetical protein
VGRRAEAHPLNKRRLQIRTKNDGKTLLPGILLSGKTNSLPIMNDGLKQKGVLAGDDIILQPRARPIGRK